VTVVTVGYQRRHSARCSDCPMLRVGGPRSGARSGVAPGGYPLPAGCATRVPGVRAPSRSAASSSVSSARTIRCRCRSTSAAIRAATA